MRARWRIAAWGLAGGVALATGLGLLDRIGLGKSGWVFDLFAHFPKHLALVAAAGVVVALIARTWRAALTALVVGGLNALLVLTLGGYALPQPAPAGAALVHVASANLHGSSSALAKLADMAREYDADLIAIYEAPDVLTLEDAVRLFPQMHTVRLAGATPDGRKLVKRSLLLAKSANAGPVTLTSFPHSDGVVLRLWLPAVETRIRIVAAHPPSPGNPDEFADRNQQLSGLGEGLSPEDPFIVLGDFNATPWSRTYRMVPGTRAGDPRLDGSFPAFAGVLGLPIDHVLFGGGLALTDYRLGPDIGSDHLPLFATFSLPLKARPGPTAIDPAPAPRD